MWCSYAKESACNAGDMGSIPGSGRFPGEGNGNPFQSCLENPMDRGIWSVTVHRVTKSRPLLKRLSTHTHTIPIPSISFPSGHWRSNGIFLLRSRSGIHQKHAIRHLKLLLTLLPFYKKSPNFHSSLSQKTIKRVLRN